MTLSPPGAAISPCEVTNIALYGFWVLVDEREYFVPFADYPAFRSVTVGQIYAVERIGPDQLSWPLLDVDIDLGALEQPEAFPLVFQDPTQTD